MTKEIYQHRGFEVEYSNTTGIYRVCGKETLSWQGVNRIINAAVAQRKAVQS